jgi:hypothetical protein
VEAPGEARGPYAIKFYLISSTLGQSVKTCPVVQDSILNGEYSVLWAEEELLVQMAGFIAVQSDKLKFKCNVEIRDV